MRALIRRFIAWERLPKVQRAAQLMLVTAGAAAAKSLFEEVFTRLDDLEERGLAPLDDLATVGDLDRLEEKLTGTPTKSPPAVTADGREGAIVSNTEHPAGEERVDQPGT